MLSREGHRNKVTAPSPATLRSPRRVVRFSFWARLWLPADHAGVSCEGRSPLNSLFPERKGKKSGETRSQAVAVRPRQASLSVLYFLAFGALLSLRGSLRRSSGAPPLRATDPLAEKRQE
ncbi:hypothetical protein VTI74DRAFT_10568 [Chaetomium olivicolor]